MRRTILVSLLVVLSAPVFAQDELHLRKTNSLIQQVIRGERGEYPLSEYRPQEVQRSGEMVNQLTQDPFEYRRKFNKKFRHRQRYIGFSGPIIGEERSAPYYGASLQKQVNPVPIARINRDTARRIRESNLMVQQLIRERQ